MVLYVGCTTHSNECISVGSEFGYLTNISLRKNKHLHRLYTLHRAPFHMRPISKLFTDLGETTVKF